MDEYKTERFIEEVRFFRQSGKSYSDIARILGVSRSRITRLCVLHNITGICNKKVFLDEVNTKNIEDKILNKISCLKKGDRFIYFNGTMPEFAKAKSENCRVFGRALDSILKKNIVIPLQRKVSVIENTNISVFDYIFEKR